MQRSPDAPVEEVLGARCDWKVAGIVLEAERAALVVWYRRHQLRARKRQWEERAKKHGRNSHEKRGTARTRVNTLFERDEIRPRKVEGAKKVCGEI